ncbi:MAG: M23 family metallopeptidase, partial [Clostridia bacterium]|nr:M23 family metallopeptidase [Clostridia bacterium]
MIYSGKFKVPKEGHFGWRMLNGKPDDHKGIDVVGITDKHVCAVVGGRVVTSKIVTDKSNRTWEWGNFVCILGDDGRMYYYCHLSKRLVSVGRRVEAGQHI